jgi:UDP:flavonoid glycosyltransferase YjiC (YdhE family)
LLRESIESLLSSGAERMEEFRQDMRQTSGKERAAAAILDFMKKRAVE